MRPCFQIIIACVSLSISLCVHGQDNKISVDKDHIVGVIEAHFAGLESWRTGDFLVRTKEEGPGRKTRAELGPNGERFVNGPDALSLLSSSDRLHRVIFDFDNQRAFIANRTKYEVQLFDGLDKEIGKPDIRTDDRITLLDHTRKLCLARLKAGEIHRLPDNHQLSSLEQLLHGHAVPEIRLSSLSGLSNIPWSNEHVRKQVDAFRNIEFIKDISHVGGDKYQVYSQHDLVPTDPQQGHRSYVTWDVKQQVPVRFSVLWGLREEDLGVTEASNSGAAEWKLIDGHNVPISARLSSPTGREISGHRFYIEREITVDIHWFSINKEIPDDVFDEKILHDRTKLDELMNDDVFDK